VNKLSAIVVTYNRKKLLAACVCRLLDQTRPPDQILIIDNASTDGTESYLNAQGFLAHSLIHYHRLPDNVGGAGGFAEGIKLAMNSDADWIWLMDDDAMPAHDALENLLQFPLAEDCIYGSVAIGEDGEHLCWPVETVKGQKLIILTDLNEARIEVAFHPFLGFLINRKLAEKVGLPDADFFLSGDDIDYCLNISRHGGKVYLCRDSRLSHPMPPRKSIDVWGIKIDLLIQPPQRAYYNIRNKIVIARRYYGYKLWTQTLPGIGIRFLASMFLGPNRFRYIKAYVLALTHGFLDKLGKYSL
jgi:GT2 family glycosyltransferase